MALEIYEMNTTSGKVYSIGVFYNGELLAGSAPRYYKTRAGAERALARRLNK
jgi:hypothetical protein